MDLYCYFRTLSGGGVFDLFWFGFYFLRQFFGWYFFGYEFSVIYGILTT